MQHVKPLTQRPAPAQSAPLTLGQILEVIVQVMSVFGTALAAKELAGSVTTDTTTSR